MSNDTVLSLSKVIPRRTERIVFSAVLMDFSHYTEGWRVVRSRMRRKLDGCEWCHTSFGEGDSIALGFRNKHANMVLCQTCAKEEKDA